MKKKRKKKGSSLQRGLSAFLIVNIIIMALYFLFCGVVLAGIGTKRVTDGTDEALVTLGFVGERPSFYAQGSSFTGMRISESRNCSHNSQLPSPFLRRSTALGLSAPADCRYSFA